MDERREREPRGKIKLDQRRTRKPRGKIMRKEERERQEAKCNGGKKKEKAKRQNAVDEEEREG